MSHRRSPAFPLPALAPECSRIDAPLRLLLAADRRPRLAETLTAKLSLGLRRLCPLCPAFLLLLPLLLWPFRLWAGEPAPWRPLLAGYPNTPAYLVAVDKSRQMLAFFEKNSPLRLARVFACTTGQAPGDKLAQGDLKTPEGIYFVVQRIGGGLDFWKYGHEAYTLNYPNPVDRLRKKTGYGIWIHGRGEPLAPLQTEGCVAMYNEDLSLLGKLLQPGTAVALTETFAFHPDADSAVSGKARLLEKRVLAWSEAWAARSARYFDFYDQAAYSLAQGESFAAFRAQKERLFKSLPWIRSTVRDIRALQGPGYWVTWFHQNYEAPNLSTSGIRRLYWAENAQGEFKILGMEWLPGLPSFSGGNAALDELASLPDYGPVINSWPPPEHIGFASFIPPGAASPDKDAGPALILADNSAAPPPGAAIDASAVLSSTAAGATGAAAEAGAAAGAARPAPYALATASTATPTSYASAAASAAALAATPALYASVTAAVATPASAASAAPAPAASTAPASASVATPASAASAAPASAASAALASAASTALASASAAMPASASAAPVLFASVTGSAATPASASAATPASASAATPASASAATPASASAAAPASASAATPASASAAAPASASAATPASASAATPASASAAAPASTAIPVPGAMTGAVLGATADVASFSLSSAPADADGLSPSGAAAPVAFAGEQADIDPRLPRDHVENASQGLLARPSLEALALARSLRREQPPANQPGPPLHAETSPSPAQASPDAGTPEQPSGSRPSLPAREPDEPSQESAPPTRATRRVDADLAADGLADAAPETAGETAPVRKTSAGKPDAPFASPEEIPDASFASLEEAPDAADLEARTDSIADRVEAWRRAWQSGLLDAYMGFYAPDAVQGSRKGATEIRRQKRRVWAGAAPAAVALDNMRILVKNDVVIADMRQRYSDKNGNGDVGLKRLTFKQSNGVWLITQEDWSPLPHEISN